MIHIQKYVFLMLLKNIRALNLISRTNETRCIKFHETCKCKCRLDASVCNNKQHWNEDKCRCECKELIDKVSFDREFIWIQVCFCTLYIVLFSIIFSINIGIGTFLFTANTWILIKKGLIKALFFKQQFTKLVNGKYQTNRH